LVAFTITMKRIVVSPLRLGSEPAQSSLYCASNQRLQNRQMRDIFFIAVAKPLRCRESLLLMATRCQHQAP
jgi:hypothetical protein